ncbi:hypothetical protein [Embleya sp. NPDC020630]|uniref:hypothetical protein n=1 Tax=Embleya sp. NPDC020630 TaxID=3363979 RepID=UPI00379BE52B
MRLTTFVHSRQDREYAVVVAPWDHAASGYSMVGDPFGSATDGVKDHSVPRYIAAIEKNLTPADRRA